MTWEMEMNYQYHKGIEQGVVQGKKDTALKFLEMGLPIEQIAQGTGLNKDEILALKKEDINV